MCSIFHFSLHSCKMTFSRPYSYCYCCYSQVWQKCEDFCKTIHSHIPWKEKLQNYFEGLRSILQACETFTWYICKCDYFIHSPIMHFVGFADTWTNLTLRTCQDTVVCLVPKHTGRPRWLIRQKQWAAGYALKNSPIWNTIEVWQFSWQT